MPESNMTSPMQPVSGTQRAAIRAGLMAGKTPYRIAGELGMSRHVVARVAREIVIPVLRAPVPPEPTERERAGLAPLPAGHPIALAVLRDAWGMGR